MKRGHRTGQHRRPAGLPRIVDWIWLCALTMLTSVQVHAAGALVIGILADHPADTVQARWQPLAAHLESALPRRQVSLIALPYAELEARVANQTVDFVLTDPSHFVSLRRHNPLTGALVTLVNRHDRDPVSGFGGVILSAVSRTEITELADLAGLPIAAAHPASLGGYHAQIAAFVEQGLAPPDPSQLDFLHGTYAEIVEAVLAGRYAAGFVRSGVLEAMVREGRLELAQIRILNRQRLPAFPFALSTRLYPEWPLFATPQVDETTTRRVAAALLHIEPDSALTHALGIHGFSVAADYQPVEALLRTLRAPPFDGVPAFTLHDVWEKHRIWLLPVVALLLLWSLAGIALLKITQRLTQANQRFTRLFDNLPAPVLILRKGCVLDCNPAAVAALGHADKTALLGRPPAELSPLRQPDGELSGAKSERQFAALRDSNRHVFDWAFRTADGSDWLAEVTLLGLSRHGAPTVLCIWHDITERARTEAALRHERDLFSGGPVVVLTWSPEAHWPVRHASSNCESVLGFTREELCAPAFRYDEIIHPDDRERIYSEVGAHIDSGAHRFEQWYRLRNKDGAYAWYYDFTELVRDAHGTVTVIHGYLVDQTPLKELELALARERRSLNNILWATGAGTWEWNVQTGQTCFNERWAEMLGYTLEELSPTSIETWIALTHPDDLGRSNALLQRHFDGELDRYECEARMRHKLGHWVWILDRGKVVSHGDDGRPLWMAGTHTDICDRKAAEAALAEQREQLERLAHCDPLTGLPNRRLFGDRLAQAIAQADRAGYRLAVCYLDLDGFKPVNDTHGHAAGDHLLVEISERLRTVLRNGDSLARVGGDEFVLLLCNVGNDRDCTVVLNRILATIAAPVTIGDALVAVSGSLGAAIYPDDESSGDMLIRHADQAMYLAKQAGRNRWHLFDAQRDHEARRLQLRQHEIAQGLADGQFVLHYQPKLNQRTGAVIGVEALLRWQHPTDGLLAPAAFLSDIARHPLEIAVGDWVLETALAQSARWRANGLRLHVSVNIDANHLLSDGFAARLAQLLARHPSVPAACVELEILECATMSCLDRAVETIAECKSLGVSFSLDDFGTGFASLAYFRRLPIDRLKIDQSFVRDMLEDEGDLAIVESVIRLARAFCRPVIAEGVETRSHADLLMQLGCEQMQGYGLARPMPANEVSAWIEARAHTLSPC